MSGALERAKMFERTWGTPPEQREARITRLGSGSVDDSSGKGLALSARFSPLERSTRIIRGGSSGTDNHTQEPFRQS